MTLLPSLGDDGRFPPATTLIRSHSRSLNGDGTTTTSDTYLLRQPDHDLLLAVVFSGIDTPFLYDPPLDLTVYDEASANTEQTGTLSGVYTYTLTSAQSQVASVESPFGEWFGCRQVDVELILSTASEMVRQDRTVSYYCPESGLVAQTSSDGNGNLLGNTYTLHTIAASNPLSISTLLPPLQPLSPPAQIEHSIADWKLSYTPYAASRRSATPSSIAPLYVAAPIPYLLAATRNGPLLALDAQQPELLLGEFQSAGSIDTPPAIDPSTGYIYLGSNKQLTALTGDGLFLWQVATNDNIAAQPTIVQEMVIAVAENGSVFALDKITGAERWHVFIDSVSIAAPARLPTPQGDLVVVGGDEGIVKALEMATGRVVWETGLDGAIRVPMRVYNATLYVGTSAALYALSGDGTLLWRADVLTPLRTAPAFDDERLYTVDSQGWLYAFGRDDGHLLWRGDQPGYLGPPIRLAANENFLLVAAMDGTISAFSPLGELIRQWHVSDLYPTEETTQLTFSLGPTFGDGALWLGDDKGGLLRLGPPLALP